MSSLLITNIGELRTVGELGTLHDVAIVAEDSRIAWIGEAGTQ